MREITLTRGKVAIVDDEDFEGLSKLPWIATFKRDRWYATRTEGPRIARRTTAMHRVILGLTNPTIEGDHINGDTLDNRRHNLRPATRMQNQRNSRPSRSRKSCAFKGVTFVNRAGYELARPWVAQITVGGRHINIGYFAIAEEAAHAYDAAAREHFGEFARLNFSEENS